MLFRSSSALDRGGINGGVCSMAMQLPLLISSAIRGDIDGHTYELASALTLLEAGIYTLDHIMDKEVDGVLTEVPPGAVLLGAICLLSYLPNRVLLAPSNEPATSTVLIRTLAEGLAKIGAGQLEDIAPASIPPTSRTIEFAIRMKTGERRALITTMAAHLSGGTPAQIEAYADFGRALGIARQLRSDLADLFGAAPSRDLASQTLTLPLALYLERENRDRAIEMETLLATAGKCQRVQRQVCDRLRDSGVMRDVVAMIERQCREALEKLVIAQPQRYAGLLLRDLALAASVAAA